MRKYNIQNFNLETNMGRSLDGLPCLTKQENENLNEIGYSGKLKGIKTNREEYLNSLNKGEFSVAQTKFDNGSFAEEFLITRVTKKS